MKTVSLENFKEIGYIQSMLQDIEKERIKYEPNRKEILSVQDFCDETEDDYGNDFSKYEHGYEKYVENEYIYFRQIATHYKNIAVV